MARKKKLAYEYDKSMTTYFEEISKYSILSKDEELKLWRRYKNENDLKARDKLVSSNLRFVANVAKKYQGNGLSYSDLIAEGNIGLLKAIERFDGERGFKAISYSVWWIKQTIMEAINKRGLIQSEELPTEHERQPDEEDIFSDNAYKSVSNDIAFDEGTVAKEEEMNKVVNNLMSCLNEREKIIVTKYYGLNGCKPETLENIGKTLNLTKERIRQINEKALKKLRTGALNNSITTDIYS